MVTVVIVLGGVGTNSRRRPGGPRTRLQSINAQTYEPTQTGASEELNTLISTGRAIAVDATVSDFAKEEARGAVRFKEDAVDLLMDLGAPFADLRSVLNGRDPQDRRHAPGTPVLLPEKIETQASGPPHLLDSWLSAQARQSE